MAVLTGIEILLLTSSPVDDGKARPHRNAIDAAIKADVERIASRIERFQEAISRQAGQNSAS